jgi:hypothetical protein
MALVAVVTAAVGVLAVPGPTGVRGGGEERTAGDLEQNRRRIEQARADPEHYERLQRDLRTFLSLPPERRDRLRQLDRDLHRKDVSGARLARVLERYTNWLEQLPPEKRQKIEQAADARERLRLIRDFRDQEGLPKHVWDELQKKPPRERAAEVRRLRRLERERRADWLAAFRHWDERVLRQRPPTHLENLPAMQNFVKNYLRSLLSKEEEQRLQEAEGQWPLFPRTLVELADRHPFFLPGPVRGPTRFEELPAEVRQILAANLDPLTKERLRLAQGHWPGYAIAVTEVARQKNVVLPQQLGPATQKELVPYLRHSQHPHPLRWIMMRLGREDRERLKRAEGTWPDYPRTLAELAVKNHFPVPGDAIVGLPGPREYWDTYRPRPWAKAEALPDVPDTVLFDFALNELTARERAAFHISFADPACHERIKFAYYWKQHPDEIRGPANRR